MIQYLSLVKAALLILTFNVTITCYAADFVDPLIDDSPLEEPIVLPDLFKLSFLEIASDIEEAKENNKKGLIVYFGQKYCPYCKAHLKNNWGQKDIVDYTEKNFDVIAINVKGQRPVIDIDGKTYSEKEFSARKKTNFTPSILFYNTKGKAVLRLRGYRPPYQFRAALEYVADAHYQKESFRNYMARAEAAMSYGKAELNSNKLFNEPPYLLDRSRIKAQQPLMVMFERKRCHACDVLHGGPLVHQEIEAKLLQLENIQLDVESDQPIITPAGERTTATKWADQLKINYSPTIIFFDRKGKEIIRIESVVWFYRLRNVLNYVLTGAYQDYATFQLWRQAENLK